MIQQAIDELRDLKEYLQKNSLCASKDIFTLDKAIIMCERCRRYKKKAKRWKRKYLELKGGAE